MANGFPTEGFIATSDKPRVRGDAVSLMLKKKSIVARLEAPETPFDWKSHALELRGELARLRREKKVLIDAIEIARNHMDHFIADEQKRFADILQQMEGKDHAVQCPHCHATRNFFTIDAGTMIRVLEDAGDTDLLEEGRTLICEHCGEMFLCPAVPVAANE